MSILNNFPTIYNTETVDDRKYNDIIRLTEDGGFFDAFNTQKYYDKAHVKDTTGVSATYQLTSIKAAVAPAYYVLQFGPDLFNLLRDKFKKISGTGADVAVGSQYNNCKNLLTQLFTNATITYPLTPPPPTTITMTNITCEGFYNSDATATRYTYTQLTTDDTASAAPATPATPTTLFVKFTTTATISNNIPVQGNGIVSGTITFAGLLTYSDEENTTETMNRLHFMRKCMFYTACLNDPAGGFKRTVGYSNGMVYSRKSTNNDSKLIPPIIMILNNIFNIEETIDNSTGVNGSERIHKDFLMNPSSINRFWFLCFINNLETFPKEKNIIDPLKFINSEGKFNMDLTKTTNLEDFLSSFFKNNENNELYGNCINDSNNHILYNLVCMIIDAMLKALALEKINNNVDSQFILNIQYNSDGYREIFNYLNGTHSMKSLMKTICNNTILNVNTLKQFEYLSSDNISDSSGQNITITAGQKKITNENLYLPHNLGMNNKPHFLNNTYLGYIKTESDFDANNVLSNVSNLTTNINITDNKINFNKLIYHLTYLYDYVDFLNKDEIISPPIQDDGGVMKTLGGLYVSDKTDSAYIYKANARNVIIQTNSMHILSYIFGNTLNLINNKKNAATTLPTVPTIAANYEGNTIDRFDNLFQMTSIFASYKLLTDPPSNSVNNAASISGFKKIVSIQFINNDIVAEVSNSEFTKNFLPDKSKYNGVFYPLKNGETKIMDGNNILYKKDQIKENFRIFNLLPFVPTFGQAGVSTDYGIFSTFIYENLRQIPTGETNATAIKLLSYLYSYITESTGNAWIDAQTPHITLDQEAFKQYAFHPIIRCYFYLTFVMEGFINCKSILNRIIPLNPVSMPDISKTELNTLNELKISTSKLANNVDVQQRKVSEYTLNSSSTKNNLIFMLCGILLFTFIISSLYMSDSIIPNSIKYISLMIICGLLAILTISLELYNYLSDNIVKEHYTNANLNNAIIDANAIEVFTKRLVFNKRANPYDTGTDLSNFDTIGIFLHDEGNINDAPNTNNTVFNQHNIDDSTNLLPLVMYPKYKTITYPDISLEINNIDGFNWVANMYMKKFLSFNTGAESKNYLAVSPLKLSKDHMKQLYQSNRLEYLKQYLQMDILDKKTQNLNMNQLKQSQLGLLKYSYRMKDFQMNQYVYYSYYLKMLFITICAILILIGIAMSGNMPNGFILVCATLVFLLFGILFLFKCLNDNSKNSYNYKQ
jgi:hypothetical protein